MIKISQIKFHLPSDQLKIKKIKNFLQVLNKSFDQYEVLARTTVWQNCVKFRTVWIFQFFSQSSQNHEQNIINLLSDQVKNRK